MVKSIKKKYLDYASGARANASSVHSFGVEAKKSLAKARREVADILRAQSEEIIFTSGGTESNNLAIQGVVLNFWEQNLKKIPHIITTNIEHPSVLETFKALEKRKLAEISVVGVESNGVLDPKKIKKEIRKNTILISVMYANNEIGTVQPIREIAKEIKHYKKAEKFSKENFSALSFPYFHTDAVQASNYLDLNVEKLGVDMLSLSGSKIESAGLPPARAGGAQAGRVGVLLKKRSVALSSVYYGGDQEMGLRPGTENLAEILKFAEAFKNTQDEKFKSKEVKRLTKLRDYFIKKLLENSFNEFSPIVNGDLKERLPNNVNVTFPKIPSELLVIELSERGIMCSSKSACKSKEKGGSYVIRAIRGDANPEIGGVRFSFGRDTKKEDLDYTLKSLKTILQKLKKWYS